MTPSEFVEHVHALLSEYTDGAITAEEFKNAVVIAALEVKEGS